MSLDPRELRDALGRFATGVTVVTANPKGFSPLGMTANSFSALSLDPPLVLWSLQKNSDCFAAFKAADGFAVNVLADDQMDLSNGFAKKGQHELPVGTFRQGKSGQPVLKNCLVSFECKMWASYEGGDHVILVGEVIAMNTRMTGKPLVFASGQYRELR
ncbi:MAG: flavin reductase (DIM6/NTAB) family NADH-FMN oxidoreductase RutF [Porticoccus sp.]|jgi:flavin reductase (DIM6/NTAB) family NADH-FMN oxidoreductase RutF